MNSIQFIKGQAGVPKTLPGEDHISGMLMFCADLPTADAGVSGFGATDRIKAISTIEMAESMGIRPSASSWFMRVLHYHLSEVFRINPAIELFVGIYAVDSNYDAIKAMQNYAQGRMRQIAIVRLSAALTSAAVVELQGVADTLDSQAQPLQILAAFKVADISTLPTGLSGPGRKNVSIVIGQDGAGRAEQLYNDPTNVTNKNTVSCIGLALGHLSLSAVHESISWVQRFPSGIDEPAFVDGKLLRNLDKAQVAALDAARMLFLIKHNGIPGSYWNDSHTLDIATSDYAYIEANRTMDKAIRGIRTYLVPYLSSPLYVDPVTGKLDAPTVKFLEELAGTQLEQMERARELSGYRVEVDPNQNVLATSTVEFVVKQVAVGVMRRISVKIGFTTKLD